MPWQLFWAPFRALQGEVDAVGASFPALHALRKVKASFEERREQQVAVVLSRLQGDHFELSLELKEEAKESARARQEAQELQLKLERASTTLWPSVFRRF